MPTAQPSLYDQYAATLKNQDSIAPRLLDLYRPIETNARAQLDSQTADAIKKLRAGQAARGVLRSGIADYPTTELYKANQNSLGNILASLSSSIGNTTGQDVLSSQADARQKIADQEKFSRDLELARSLGKGKKPSTLDEIFGVTDRALPIFAQVFGGGAGKGYASIFNGANKNGGDTSSLFNIFGGGGGGGGSEFTGLV